jgi:hypothetical protein
MRVSSLLEPGRGDKKVQISDSRGVILFSVKEMTMGNDMGKLAIFDGDNVLGVSENFYPAWEGPVVLGKRFAIFTSGRCLSHTPYKYALSHHIFDVEGLLFAEVPIGIIEAGGYVFQKDMTYGFDGDQFSLDGKVYPVKALAWNWLTL